MPDAAARVEVAQAQLAEIEASGLLVDQVAVLHLFLIFADLVV